MQKITVFTDGGARGNPGPSGIGAQFLDEKNVVMTELSEYIGEATNNIAEYTAVKRALEHMETFVADTKAVHVLCKLDSQLVECQLKGEYQVKDQTLKTYFEEIKVLMNNYASVSFEHVKRAENEEADRLVNEAIDAGA